MLRSTELNLEEIKYDLTKKASEIYVETGYTLLGLEQLVSLFQIEQEKQKKPTYGISSLSFIDIRKDKTKWKFWIQPIFLVCCRRKTRETKEDN